MIIPAVFIVLIFVIISLKANTIWYLEIKREFEKELIFRGKQYVYAIEKYNKKYTNIPLKDLKTLYDKRYIRQLFKDPISLTGKWNLVMKTTSAGGNNKKLLIVPEELADGFLSNANIIGVCSTADDIGYKEYRGKKNYNEWAFYVGAKENKDMPELKFINDLE